MSRSTLRILGFVGAVVVVWYVAYLHTEIAELRSQVAAGRGSSPPAAAPERPRADAPAARAPAAAGARSLTPEQREAMIERLGGRGTSQPHPVWFATIPNNAEATAFQRALQSVFEEAGWQVRGNAPVRFPMKAGIYLFAADEEAPEYVSTAHEALEAAGFTVTAGRGYRDYYRQKKQENPDWIGIELGPDETYVIAIGRKPEEEPAL